MKGKTRSLRFGMEKLFTVPNSRNNPIFSAGSTNVTQNIRKIKLPARSSLIGSNAKGTVNSSNVNRYVAISSG